MENIPDEIRLLVFETYSLDLRCSPANLLTISRRWHNVALSTCTIWTRLPIYITSLRTIPFILGGDTNSYGTLRLYSDDSKSTVISFAQGPLSRYLQRSIRASESKRLPLDLTITWYKPDNWNLCDEEKEYLKKWREDGKTLDRKAFSTELEADALFEYRRSFIDDQFKYLTCYLSGEVQEIWENDSGYVKVHPAEVGGNRIRRLEVYFQATRRDYGLLSLIHLGPLVELEWAHLQKCVDIPFGDGESLHHLEVIRCDIEIWPSMHNLTTLVIQGYDDERDLWLPWDNLASLECLQVAYLELILANPPPPDSVPKLRSILVRYFVDHPTGFGLLEARFNSSRPLELLTLNEKKMHDYYLYFRKSPSFCVKTLKLSSLNLKNRPKEFDWNWNEYGEVTWNVRSLDIRGARSLLQELDGRGTKVVPMDAQMKKLIALARGEEEEDEEDEEEEEYEEEDEEEEDEDENEDGR